MAKPLLSADSSLQQKKSLFILEIRDLAESIPPQYAVNFSPEFVEELALALADGSIFDIIKELREVQRITEANLNEVRCNELQGQEVARQHILHKSKPLFSTELAAARASGAMYIGIDTSREDPELIKYDENAKEDVKRSHTRIIMELDQLVTQQQLTLQQAGLPGFKLTNQPNSLRLQMYILEFIDKIQKKFGF